MSLVSRPEQPAELKVCCGDHGTNDRDVQRLRDLIASGVDQWTASRRVWGEQAEAGPGVLWAASLLGIVVVLAWAAVGGAR